MGKKMKQNLILLDEFIDAVGLDESSPTYKRSSQSFAHAIVRKNGERLIDIDDEKVFKYMENRKAHSGRGDHDRGVNAGGSRHHLNKSKQESTVNIPVSEEESNDNLHNDVLDWTLRQVLNKFGSDVKMVDFLRARKLVAEIQEKELKIKLARGEMVKRSILDAVLIPINRMCTQLVRDVPKSLSVRIPQLAESGKSTQELEVVIERDLSKIVKSAKTMIKKEADKAEEIGNEE